MTGRGSVLFVCVENAGRSQMAEAFARRAGLQASSAGTLPSSRLNAEVVLAMSEKGIDISAGRPKMLTPEMIDAAGVVVTMGCSVEDVCPAPMLRSMKKKLVEWHLEDPKGKDPVAVRAIRDEIEHLVGALASDIGRPPS